jgi:hypothetical protein
MQDEIIDVVSREEDDTTTERLLQRYAVAVLDFAFHQSSSGDEDNSGVAAAVDPVFADPATDVCQWQGISCSTDSNVVVELKWPGQDLTGSIPADIGLLKSLTTLDLGENALTGSIPEQLYDLTEMQYLYLHQNQLTGAISPKIGNMQSLLRLYLGDNELTGSFPRELGSPGSGAASIRPLGTFWYASKRTKSLSHFSGASYRNRF